MKIAIVIFLLSLLDPTPPSSSFSLIAKPSQIVGCGGFLFAGQFLFLNNEDSTLKIGIILCPDGYDSTFFKVDANYTIDFLEDSILPEGYNYMNEFEMDKYVPKRHIGTIKFERQ